MNTHSRTAARISAIFSLLLLVSNHGLMGQELAVAQRTVEPVSLRDVTVASGGEWVESVEVGHARLRAVSRPRFSAVASAVPIMEIGAASVSFVRDEFGGVLVLVGREEKVLPYVIALDAEGRSRDPLDLALSYNAVSGEASFRIGDAVHAVAAITEDGDSLEAVISAGSEGAWTIEVLELASENKADDADEEERPASKASDGEVTVVRLTKAEMLAYKQQRLRSTSEARELFLKSDKNRAERALFANNRHAPGTLGWHMESATKLTHMALTLRQRYEVHKAVEVGLRAQALLREAELLAASQWPKSQAAVHELAGFVWGDVLEDRNAAKREFDKALERYPEAPRALEAKRRLEVEDARRSAISNHEKRSSQ